MIKPKIIAFYLPQYHPTPDNDKWWGKGFTEWTNVGKAKPLFRGHYQPKVPADLGYYDLRLPEVRDAQAKLAQEAGIYGFCYYHYWFGNGKEELELPFNEVLRLGKPDFPFMLCWANESWHQKFWNKDGKGSSKKVLIEQKYPGKEDIIQHFYSILPAFKDDRYIKKDGNPVFMIYNPIDFPDTERFIAIWNKLAVENGFPGIYFTCQLRNDFSVTTINNLINRGYKLINTMRLWEAFNSKFSLAERIIRKLNRKIRKIPNIRKYEKIISNILSTDDKADFLTPTIIPNWDHTPRSKNNGTAIINSTPALFKLHVKQIIGFAKKYNKEFVFLKSWNEWGEGNYMEPDYIFGKGYIQALGEVMSEIDHEYI